MRSENRTSSYVLGINESQIRQYILVILTHLCNKKPHYTYN